MNTKDIMQLALEMAGMDSIPADSGILLQQDGANRATIVYAITE